MPDQCKHCGCTEIDVDPSRGDSVCTGCGVVLSEHVIVSEVQFMENSRGQSSAIGQFISHESTAPRSMFKGGQGAFSKESRDITYYKGKRQIIALSDQLGLKQHCQDVAYNFFKMCVMQGITKGRKRDHVIGGCVYLACRTEGTPHMLIDVSDALQADVYEVGRTYLRISKLLCIAIPLIDPCLYIIRFSHKLKFGDKTHVVSETALRLVKRMKKDWMDTGRRPSGVCGAALVIAARFHNFNRTIQDVIKIVKVHESTVRKRLTEFGNTQSSELTPEEFMREDLRESEDPPAFKAARRKEDEEKLQKLLEAEENLKGQFTEMQIEIDRALSDHKTKLRGKYSSVASSAPPTPTPVCDAPCVNKEAKDAVKFIAESTMESIQECINVSLEETNNETSQLQGIFPSTATMGLDQTIEQCMEVRPSEPMPEESGILDLEGIDDDEIDSYILSDKEKELKTNFWMSLNKDYLEEEEKKKEQQRLEEEQRIREGKPIKKKKIYRKKYKNDRPANTAGEAMERMIKVKKLSNKIDYSVLKNLNGDCDEGSGTHSIVSRGSASSRTSRTSKRSNNHHPPIPNSFREIMQSLTGQKTPLEALQQEIDIDAESSSPHLKKQRLDDEMAAEKETSSSMAPPEAEADEDDAEEEMEEDDEHQQEQEQEEDDSCGIVSMRKDESDYEDDYCYDSDC